MHHHVSELGFVCLQVGLEAVMSGEFSSDIAVDSVQMTQGFCKRKCDTSCIMAVSEALLVVLSQCYSWVKYTYF